MKIKFSFFVKKLFFSKKYFHFFRIFLFFTIKCRIDENKKKQDCKK